MYTKAMSYAQSLYRLQATEGKGVTGRKLFANDGFSVRSPIGRNTVMSEDKTQLLADVDGHVTLNGVTVNVSDTYFVTDDVDVSTGSIEFVGNVHVSGTVQEDFTVKAGGNVEIGGSVQGGSIVLEET